MNSVDMLVSRWSRRAWVGAAVAASMIAPLALGAQESERDLEILRLEGTPIGALPPIALPMPASRNHNYWGGRIQTGYRRAKQSNDLLAIAGGVDFQFRGGSIYGVTAGYQQRQCDVEGDRCGGHAMFGARSRFNLVTGGPTIGTLFNDPSATSTLGTEIGIGYSPNVVKGMNACAVDIGLPLSIAMMERRRIVSYFTPGMVWDWSCGPSGPPTKTSYLSSFGVGLQQLYNRSLDVYVGVQKIFRAKTGYQVGISFTYVRLP